MILEQPPKPTSHTLMVSSPPPAIKRMRNPMHTKEIDIVASANGSPMMCPIFGLEPVHHLCLPDRSYQY